MQETGEGELADTPVGVPKYEREIADFVGAGAAFGTLVGVVTEEGGEEALVLETAVAGEMNHGALAGGEAVDGGVVGVGIRGPGAVQAKAVDGAAADTAPDVSTGWAGLGWAGRARAGLAAEMLAPVSGAAGPVGGRRGSSNGALIRTSSPGRCTAS